VSRRARPTLWPYSFARPRVLSYTLSMRTVPHRLHRPASRHRGACPSCSSLSTLAALRRLASRGRRLAPAGRAARKPARAAALTAAPPRPCAQAQSLLLHVLIVALVSEGGELGAAQFERLRGALRAAPADLAGLYRCAPAGRGPATGRAAGWPAIGRHWALACSIEGCNLACPTSAFRSAALSSTNRAWAVCPRAWLSHHANLSS